MLMANFGRSAMKGEVVMFPPVGQGDWLNVTDHSVLEPWKVRSSYVRAGLNSPKTLNDAAQFRRNVTHTLPIHIYFGADYVDEPHVDRGRAVSRRSAK
nr:hypothetical protein CFP56_02534 [Quercus suber]